jgi:glycosyltransferase involved in cell wall biosynthesis
MSLYIDLTEFLASLRRSGIERISGEICKHAPAESLIPIRHNSDRYLSLPVPLINLVGKYFRDNSGSEASEIRRLAAVDSGLPLKVSKNDIILVPEIFAGPRAEFFRQMPEQELQRYRFIVYDLLPATHPEYFPPDLPLILSQYFRIVRRATCCAFISEYTRDVYIQRLKRTDRTDGEVLSLGSDALGPKAGRPLLNRPLTFSVLGTIEPRKNHELILEAVEPLLGKVEGLSLSFIGKMGWVDPDFARKVEALASDKNSGFRFFPSPSDDMIRSHIEQSRATIYVSAAEGYGLPPVESLWLGTPVIASKMNPSLVRLGDQGIHYVDPLTVMNLRRAILEFLDDDYANRKTEQISSLNLPTWRSFTEEVLRWCGHDS